MKILYYILLILFTFLFGQSIGQKNMTKQDKKLLKSAKLSLSYNDYIKAYTQYEKLFENYKENAEVLYGFGICKLNRRGEEKTALPLFIQANKNGKKLTDILFYLGKTYHLHHKLDLAISSFEAYKMVKNGNIEMTVVNRNIEIAINAKKQIASARDVDVINLGAPINSINEESVPVVLPNGAGLFFTSRRKGGYSDAKDFQGNYMQDIYFSAFENSKWQEPTNSKNLNSRLHDGCVSISHNGSTLITYNITEDSSGATSIFYGNLYYSNFLNGKWTSPVKFGPTVNSEYQELSACLSLDENTLYFSSDRPGGYGGFDLYKVQRLPNLEWGKPINLGPNVNTEFNEDAPFMHADGETLYFSSEGHSTMGGFDIFKTKQRDNMIWSTPENIGYPINTVEHDIYFTLSANNKTAYYSSDREDSFGNQDIYQIRMLDNDNYQTVVKCTIYDKENNIPLSATATLIDEASHKLNGIYQSNSGTGNFIMVILPEVQYQLVIEAKGYTSRILHMSFSESDDPNMLHSFTLSKSIAEK